MSAWQDSRAETVPCWLVALLGVAVGYALLLVYFLNALHGVQVQVDALSKSINDMREMRRGK